MEIDPLPEPGGFDYDDLGRLATHLHRGGGVSHLDTPHRGLPENDEDTRLGGATLLRHSDVLPRQTGPISQQLSRPLKLRQAPVTWSKLGVSGLV